MQNINAKLDAMNIRKPNTDAEHIAMYGWDTLIWTKKSENEDFAVIGSANLFDAREKKHEILKTNDFPLANGKVPQILGLAVKTNIRPADLKNLLPFENNSRISVNIEDTDYSDLPIAHLLQYNRVAVGSNGSIYDITSEVEQLASDPVSPSANQVWYNTTTGQLKIRKGTVNVILPSEIWDNNLVFLKPGDFTALIQPIDPPHQGTTRFQFKPGVQNMITASVEEYGAKFGAGVVDSIDSPVFYLQIMWVGDVIRAKKR